MSINSDITQVKILHIKPCFFLYTFHDKYFSIYYIMPIKYYNNISWQIINLIIHVQGYNMV